MNSIYGKVMQQEVIKGGLSCNCRTDFHVDFIYNPVPQLQYEIKNN
jgi:hypothetical protein